MRLFNILFEEHSVHNTNLDTLYNKFNRKYFDNELPKVPISWNNNKRSGGMVKAKYNRSTGEINIISFQLSKQFKMSEEHLHGIMMHEMIHVYLFHVGIPYTTGKDKMHGIEFMAKLRELRKKVPFDIPVTEEVSEMEVSDHIKMKPVVVIEIGPNSIIPVSTKGFDSSDKEKFIQMLSRRIKNIEIYVSNSNVLSKFPVKRKLETVKGSYKISDDDIKKIRDKKITHIYSMIDTEVKFDLL